MNADLSHWAMIEPPFFATASRGGVYRVMAVAEVCEATAAKLTKNGAPIFDAFRDPPPESWGLVGWQQIFLDLDAGDRLAFELSPMPPAGMPVVFSAVLEEDA